MAKRNTLRARLIVCERKGIWAGALRPHLPSGVRLQEVRGLAECAAELALAPASLLAIELDPARVAETWLLLAELGHRYWRARAVILGRAELADFEASMRETGAVHWVVSTRQCAEVGRIAQRHFGHVVAGFGGARDEIWRGLPWDDLEAVAH